MAEEATPATQAAPEGTTAPETPAIEVPAAEGEQQTPQTDAKTPATTEEPAQPKREPWFNRRIDELTKARREAERERDALRSMIEQGATPQTPAPSAPAADPWVLAKKIANQQALNDAANATYQAGKAEFGVDFDEAVSTLRQVTDLSQHTDFLEAVTALPNAAQVYHHLGKNPDEAAHVLSLSPVKMAIALAQVAAKVGRPKPQSKAPAPITPVGKSAAPSSAISDDLPVAEWMARRQAQLEARRK